MRLCFAHETIILSPRSIQQQKILFHHATCMNHQYNIARREPHTDE